MTPEIIFEDDSLLVIDKPAGMVVNRAETVRKEKTIQDWVESRRPETSEYQSESSEFSDRSGVVHRLDKDTSGLLVIAKTPQAFEHLKGQFKSREVVKKYLVLVHGKVEPPEGRINAPIARSPFNRRHFGVFPGGREAETGYRSLKSLKLLKMSEDFSFLEVMPRTGRTHQIRVHMKYVNHPVVSDPIYGGRKAVREDLKWCPRLFLHAASLSLKHPTSGEMLTFSSPLPPELLKSLELLK